MWGSGSAGEEGREEQKEVEKEEDGDGNDDSRDKKLLRRRVPFETRVLVDDGTAPGASGLRAFPFFRA